MGPSQVRGMRNSRYNNVNSVQDMGRGWRWIDHHEKCHARVRPSRGSWRSHRPARRSFSRTSFRSLRRASESRKNNGSLMLGQIDHPGRQIDDTIQDHPISASDSRAERTILGFQAAKAGVALPKDIATIVDQFAKYLEQADFDGVSCMRLARPVTFCRDQFQNRSV